MFLSDFVIACEDAIDAYGDLEVKVNVVTENGNSIKTAYYDEAILSVNSDLDSPCCFLKVGDNIDEID